MIGFSSRLLKYKILAIEACLTAAVMLPAPVAAQASVDPAVYPLHSGGAVAQGSGPEAPTAPGAFQPVAPSRFLDTRSTRAVGADSAVSFQVGGVKGIPANASAVVFNLTVTEPRSFGFITAYASGTPRPDASNANFSAGQTVPNSVTVPVGADGKVTLFNRSSGTTQLIADVSGYFLSGKPIAAGTFAPVEPSRFLDTRRTRAVGADSAVSFQVGGVNGIPANASAVVFNLTVTEPRSFGFITAYASGTRRPDASNANFSAAQTVPNSVTVPIGPDGKVTLFNRSSGTTQLIADVSGYYLPGKPTAAGAFQPIEPSRFLDTRGTRATGADSAVSFQVGGVKEIPANASAIVFNLTVTEPRSFGFIAAHASGTARPTASNANFSADQTVPNSVTVPVGTDGRVTMFNRSSGSTQLVADVSGYYLPGTGTSSVGGAVWAWGSNQNGELGNGTTTDSPAPIQVPGLTGVTAFVSNGKTKFAIMGDGTVRAWGHNGSGQLGNGTTTDSSVPVQIQGLTGVRSIDATAWSAYALMTDGTVWAWGQNLSGQLGNGTVTESLVPVQVQGLTGVKSITTAQETAFALLDDGTVRSWGNNRWGTAGIPFYGNAAVPNWYVHSVPAKIEGLTGVKSISAAGLSAYAVLEDGTVRAWGYNGFGRLGNGSTSDSHLPIQVLSLSGVKSITTGRTGDTVYALLAGGTVKAWGAGFSGQLGDGTTSTSSVPVSVLGLTGVSAITAAGSGAFALLTDGSVRGWGYYNWNGDVGNETTVSSRVPVKVHGFTGVIDINATGGIPYALMADETVWSWINGTGPVRVEGITRATALMTSQEEF